MFPNSHQKLGEISFSFNVWSIRAIWHLLLGELDGKLLKGFIKQPCGPKMWAIICVVGCLRVINNPLRIIGSVVKHNVHNREHTILSKLLNGLGKHLVLCLLVDCAIEEVVVYLCLISKRVMTVRFTVNLEWSKMNSIVSEFNCILQHFWPSIKLAKLSGLNSHKTQLLAFNNLAVEVHLRRNINVHGFGIAFTLWL